MEIKIRLDASDELKDFIKKILHINEIAEKTPFMAHDFKNIPMSIRSRNIVTNCLGIKYVHELSLIKESELLNIPNFGRKSLKEIKDICKERGVTIGSSRGTACFGRHNLDWWRSYFEEKRNDNP